MKRLLTLILIAFVSGCTKLKPAVYHDGEYAGFSLTTSTQTTGVDMVEFKKLNADRSSYWAVYLDSVAAGNTDQAAIAREQYDLVNEKIGLMLGVPVPVAEGDTEPAAPVEAPVGGFKGQFWDFRDPGETFKSFVSIAAAAAGAYAGFRELGWVDNDDDEVRSRNENTEEKDLVIVRGNSRVLILDQEQGRPLTLEVNEGSVVTIDKQEANEDEF